MIARCNKTNGELEEKEDAGVRKEEIQKRLPADTH